MKNKDTVKVVFRVWTGQMDYPDVFALFPEIKSDVYGLYCTSYQHIGQHGSADYSLCIRKSRLAKPSEYKDLLKELKKIGYNPVVIKRYTRPIHLKEEM